MEVADGPHAWSKGKTLVRMHRRLVTPEFMWGAGEPVCCMVVERSLAGSPCAQPCDWRGALPSRDCEVSGRLCSHDGACRKEGVEALIEFIIGAIFQFLVTLQSQ